MGWAGGEEGSMCSQLVTLMFLFLKKSTEHMKKIPTIILSITYKGVKFIDASNKVRFAQHEGGVRRDRPRSPTCLGVQVTFSGSRSHGWC